MLMLTSVAASVVVLDQLTKWAALHYLSQVDSIPVIPHVFRLTLVRNTGIAFGLFQNHPTTLTLVISLSVAALVVFAWSMRRRRGLAQAAYASVLGGALGNWIDRIRHDHVIDFLDFHIWPVFNVADACITAGVFLFLWLAMKGPARG